MFLQELLVQLEPQEASVSSAQVQSQPLNLSVKEDVLKERVVEGTMTTDTPCLPQSQALNLCLKGASLNETLIPQSQPLDLSTHRAPEPAEQEPSALPVLTPTSLNQIIPPIDMSVFYEPISSPVSRTLFIYIYIYKYNFIFIIIYN